MLGKYDKNKQKQDTLNQMGHVPRCYKIFFHKDDNLILEIWAFKGCSLNKTCQKGCQMDPKNS